MMLNSSIFVQKKKQTLRHIYFYNMQHNLLNYAFDDYLGIQNKCICAYTGVTVAQW